MILGLTEKLCVFDEGAMKEEEVTPGTIYPLFGKLCCFLPEKLKKTLCCVTPLGQTVSPLQSRCGKSVQNVETNPR